MVGPRLYGANQCPIQKYDVVHLPKHPSKLKTLHRLFIVSIPRVWGVSGSFASQLPLLVYFRLSIRATIEIGIPGPVPLTEQSHPLIEYQRHHTRHAIGSDIVPVVGNLVTRDPLLGMATRSNY